MLATATAECKQHDACLKTGGERPVKEARVISISYTESYSGLSQIRCSSLPQEVSRVGRRTHTETTCSTPVFTL